MRKVFAISKLFRGPPTTVNRLIPLSAYGRRLVVNFSTGSQAPVPGMPPHIVALSDVANYSFFAEPDWSRKSAESHTSIGGLARFQYSSEHISRWHDSHDSVNLSDISLESSGPNAPVRNNIAGIAPSLLNRTVEPSPILSPTSSRVDAINIATPSTLRSPDNFGTGDPD